MGYLFPFHSVKLSLKKKNGECVGKTNMVALLLENGATIDAKTRDGLTPLHCAARSGHEQVVDMLLEKGAPISSKTKVSVCFYCYLMC